MNGKKTLPLIVIASMLLALTPSVMFAGAVAVPTLSAAAGQKGTTIKVTGAAGTVPAGTTVELYWDTTTGAWNGVKGLMNSTTGKASGAYEVWFDVPEATIGNHYVWIKTAAGETASAVFTVNSKQSLSATSGLAGDKVTATAYSLSGSTDVRYFFSSAAYAAWTPTYIYHAETLVASADGTTVDYSGTLAHYPVQPGNVTITVSGGGQVLTDPAKDGNLKTAGVTYGSINYITGEYSITYTVVPAALTTISAVYTYFTTSGNLYVLNQGTTTSLGTFAASVTIPAAGAGAYHIAALDGDGNEVDKAFTIGPVITLNPSVGVVGQVISVSGRGFWPTATIGGVAADVQLKEGLWTTNAVIKDMPVGGVVVDGSGRFTMNIIIPSSNGVNDDYTIQVSSSHVGDVATADFEITKQTNVNVDPKYAAQGASITVTGTGFDKVSGEEVTVELWDTGLTTLKATIGTVDTNSDGTFSKVFNVPAQVEATYKILAWTNSNIMNTTTFRIGTMYAQLSATSGPAGKGVTITGVGFTHNGAWNATIGSEDLLTTSAAGIADGNGLISKLAYIPSMAPGTYTVTIWDIAADIKITTTFAVTYNTQITLGITNAPNGYNVTINGKGFSQALANTNVNFVLYNKTSTGAYDRSWAINVQQNWRDTPGALPTAAYVNGSGTIRAYWTVLPAATLSKGTYYINATDASAMAYFAQATFTVGSKHITATPRKTSFAVGETISFTLEHTFGLATSYLKIYDPDGNLVFRGDALGTWVSSGDWKVAPYSSQTAGGNPMTIRDDATLGTWTWKWYDPVADENVATGSFTVTASATSQTDVKIAELSTQLTSLASTVSQLATTVNSVATTASSASTAASAATTAANAAKTSADAATTAATAAGTKADAATTAANSAKTSADNAAAAANGLTTLVYAAIGASLVAALAAIVALMQISRKIA